MGENDCQAGYINGLMAWADQNKLSYLGWTWNTYVEREERKRGEAKGGPGGKGRGVNMFRLDYSFVYQMELQPGASTDL